MPPRRRPPRLMGRSRARPAERRFVPLRFIARERFGRRLGFLALPSPSRTPSTRAPPRRRDVGSDANVREGPGGVGGRGGAIRVAPRQTVAGRERCPLAAALTAEGVRAFAAITRAPGGAQSVGEGMVETPRTVSLVLLRRYLNARVRRYGSIRHSIYTYISVR